MMQRIALACAVLALGIIASPSAAQQTLPDQPPATAQPTGPGEPASPTMQSMPEAPPPPFPPMPRAKPTHRWTGNVHRAPSEHHHAAQAHHRTTRADRRLAHASHRRTHEHHEAVHLSRKTIRQCHAMGYSEIMRHSNCRALMSQELDAASSRHHQAKHRRSTALGRKAKARTHHTRHHRR
jgi:hypothetical protein